jgi:hypothetical protein
MARAIPSLKGEFWATRGLARAAVNVLRSAGWHARVERNWPSGWRVRITLTNGRIVYFRHGDRLDNYQPPE